MKTYQVVGIEDYYTEDPSFLQAVGMAEDDPEETERYFSFGGDFWIDCDRVKFEGEELEFGVISNYVIANFEPECFPGHIRLILEFLKEGSPGFKQILFSGSLFEGGKEGGKAYQEARSAIAYRGGEGYVYGIYIWEGE
jgi:hypothetical protein